MRTLDKAWRFCFRYIGRPWYVWLVTALAALDLFVGFIPTDALVVTVALASRRFWLPKALLITAGSAAGAWLLGAAVQWKGEAVMLWLMPGLFETEAWKSAATFLQDWGFSAVGFVALGPLPQQPIVMMAALIHIPLWKTALAVFVGRGIKYCFFAWAATHAPRFVARFRRQVPMPPLPTSKSS